jgi:phenylacetate-CoA ligase
VANKGPSPDELEPIERASSDELQALQLQRMRWTLHHAYDHSVHYRSKLDRAGVRPEDLKSLADLSLFPFTTKADFRDNYPFGLFAVPREQVVEWNHRQGHSRGLHRARHRHLVAAHGALDSCKRRTRG